MTPTQAHTLVSTIDLNAICRKVQIQQKWDAPTTQRAEQEYRDYLEAALVNPDRMVPPSRSADEIWHAHILDTMKYADDCKRVFGGMLHHVPNYKPYLNGTITAETELCFNQRTEAKNAALCFAQKAEVKDAALCFAQQPRTADAALCFAQKETPVDAALCFNRTEQPEAKNAALCFARVESPAAAAGCVPCFGQREGVTAVKPATRRVRANARRTRRTRRVRV